MKKAIVLSGGGAKGAYHIGVWKALRKINYHFDIVTGTSIGALNGALMVTGEYRKAIKLWNNISPDLIFDEKMLDKDDNLKEKGQILFGYIKKTLNGGYSVNNLEKNIDIFLDVNKFFYSPIDFGMVTYNLTTLKPLELQKKEIKKNELHDYLVASATCFPAFKTKIINNEQFIDGGYYDNLPINLAIKMKAREVIAVDLNCIGLKRKIADNNLKIRYIKPRNKMGSFLVFNKFNAKRAIQYGYNDTMKEFNYLEGNKFTFKKGEIVKNYKKLNKKFIKLLDEVFNNTKIEPIYAKHLKAFNKIEKLGQLFNLDDSVIYKMKQYNQLLKKEVNKLKEIDKLTINDIVNNRIFDHKLIIKYLYDKIKHQEYSKIKVIGVVYLQELEFAIYLNII